jgi:hypothetical protein
MGAVTMQDWHAEAVRLRDEEGKSERAIAKELGYAPSTIHAALSAHPEPNGNGTPTPGQQTIDGDEVREIGEVRVDGTVQLGLIDFGGKAPQTAVQRHAAQVFELHVGDEEQILVGLFRQLVRADRQGAAAIADVFVREANGGS